MRSILLHVHEDGCMESRLQAALDLARQLDARLTCVQVAPYEFGIPGDFYGTRAAQLQFEYERNADKVRRKFEKYITDEDVRWRWSASLDSASKILSRIAPTRDLLILGAHNPVGKPDRPSDLAMELIFTVRAPILIVPATWKNFLFDQPAMVAWNGAPEGAHALRAAMPLLLRASQVHVLTVQEESKPDKFDMPSADAVNYLADYGIKAEVIELQRSAGHSIAETLVNAVIARKGSYLVMGAYGRSRFRERILGGVTREMLSDPQIPLLLSH